MDAGELIAISTWSIQSAKVSAQFLRLYVSCTAFGQLLSLARPRYVPSFSFPLHSFHRAGCTRIDTLGDSLCPRTLAASLCFSHCCRRC